MAHINNGEMDMSMSTDTQLGADLAASKTVLVMADTASARKWLSFRLREEGYTVIPTDNAKEALAHLQGKPRPNLILLDMAEPVLDGWLFLRKLRRSAPGCAVPVLLVTADRGDQGWALDQGCAGIIQRPVVFDDLLQSVEGLC
jgi:CheY-like chemotaxis protein